MVSERDIHKMAIGVWGHLPSEFIGKTVSVKVLCAHPFGLGVKIVGLAAYGHVNSPNVSDDFHDHEAGLRLVGATVDARVLAVDEGRQPTLSLRASDLGRGPSHD